MDKAKAAVTGFLNKDVKHDTTVHETINPAVKNEHITRTQHENQQTVIDREVHQDHHHTSVQPIQDREVLPEKHHHQMGEVEHRKINHGNDHHVREKLEAEKAQFKNTHTVGETQHTASAHPTLSGEHVHHHVHENIQPVIQKETIQPSVIHTTVPIHEVHQNEAKHHTATHLPAVTMAEFQKQGGHLGGREERTDGFNGEPRAVGGQHGGHSLGGHGATGTTSLTEKDGGNRGNEYTHGTHGTHQHNNDTTGSSTGMSGIGNTPRSEQDRLAGSTTHSSNTSGTTSDATGKKPSLLSRLNPMKDADGDGKKGIMD